MFKHELISRDSLAVNRLTISQDMETTLNRHGFDGILWGLLAFSLHLVALLLAYSLSCSLVRSLAQHVFSFFLCTNFLLGTKQGPKGVAQISGGLMDFFMAPILRTRKTNF